MKKVWINGGNGQIGKAFKDIVDPMEYELIITDKDEVDVTDMNEVFRFGDINHPDYIINCAAITNLEYCDTNEVECYKVNALGARNLALIAKKLDITLVQISSDDVFDGADEVEYKEFDETNPRTAYGKSKLAGERYVKEFTHKHFVIRSTWVYGEGVNFVNRVLECAKQGEIIAVASDQVGSPTSAVELAKFILFLLPTNEYGTYHACCQGVCSRYMLAKETLRLAGINAKVKAVPMAESIDTLERPANAVLDNFLLKMMGNYTFPQWRDALADYMKGAGKHE